MRAEIVKTILLSLIVILAGCSASRKVVDFKAQGSANGNKKYLFRDVRNRNLSTGAFQFNRVRIDYNSGSDSKSLNGYLKYNKGKILLSLRSVAGIEIARIYIDNDSLKILDRVNRIYYFQGSEYIKRKTGLNTKELLFLWGDVPADLNIIEAWEVNDTLVKYHAYGNIDGIYEIYFDRYLGKLREIRQTRNDGIFSELEYQKFEETMGKVYPSLILFSNEPNKLSVEIELNGLKTEKQGKIRFSVGEDYEKELLK